MPVEFRGGEWEGLDDLGPDALAELRAPAQATLLAVGVFLAGELKRTLSGPRHGAVYRISRTGRLHVASAPGEPPAVLYGNLRNSIGHSSVTWNDWTASIEVGVGLGQPPAGGVNVNSYAARLEFGGVDSRGTRILPRPYIEPTMVRTEQQVSAMLEAA